MEAPSTKALSLKESIVKKILHSSISPKSIKSRKSSNKSPKGKKRTNSLRKIKCDKVNFYYYATYLPVQRKQII